MQKKQETRSKATYTPRFKERYFQEVVPRLMETLGYKNRMQVPRLEAIYLNRGFGKIKSNEKAIETLREELSLIAGQKAVFAKAKKSVSNFKLREGMTIGCRVTLRGSRMYEFLDRLVSIHLPRIRDFQGTTNKLDGQGNYTIGIKEQLIFTELNLDKVATITGMNITLQTSAKDDVVGRALLKELGVPLKKSNK